MNGILGNGPSVSKQVDALKKVVTLFLTVRPTGPEEIANVQRA